MYTRFIQPPDLSGAQYKGNLTAAGFRNGGFHEKTRKKTAGFSAGAVMYHQHGAGESGICRFCKKRGGAVSKVTLNYTQYVLKKRGKLKLKASIAPKSAKAKVTYKSSNPKAVSVTSKGIVQAKASKGRAVITATAGKKKASCKVTIGIPVTAVTASDLNLTTGETAKINASVLPEKSSVKELVYQNQNPFIVKVEKNGNVTALSEGTAAVTVVAADCLKVKKTISIHVKKAEA